MLRSLSVKVSEGVHAKLNELEKQNLLDKGVVIEVAVRQLLENVPDNINDLLTKELVRRVSPVNGESILQTTKKVVEPMPDYPKIAQPKKSLSKDGK